MNYLMTMITVGIMELTFAQKEDSLMMVIDQVDISSITTHDDIRTYFKDVSKLFLEVQNKRSEVLTESGFDSPEYKNVVLKENEINEFLLTKMREYLSYHPYPKRVRGDTIEIEYEDTVVNYIQYHNLANSTVVNIFVNAPPTPDNISLNQLYFPKFYFAYKERDIYSGHIWNLLYKMYKHMKGVIFEDFEHSEEEQIEIMIDELGLSRK